MSEGMSLAGCCCSACDRWSPGPQDCSVSRATRALAEQESYLWSLDSSFRRMQNRGRYERIALELVTSGLNTRGTAMRLKTARKLAAMLLVAMAICVSAATPAYADGTDAATGFACTIA